MTLDQLVTRLEQRFGYQALRPAAELAPSRAILPTGIASVDALLDGGLLRGSAHSLSGAPTAGATSLFYAAIASAQARDLPVVYLDAAGLFDPPNAAAAGIALERLLLLDARHLPPAWLLLRQLATQALPCLVACDHAQALPLTQLRAALRDAPLTLLALSPRQLHGMPVALSLRRRHWQIARGDVTGFTSELLLRAHPFLPKRQAQIHFSIPREEACSALW